MENTGLSFLEEHFLSSVQSLSHIQLLATPWIAAYQASLFITNSRSLLSSCPLSQWYHPTILSSVIPFSSCLQSFPASGSFPMSQFFPSGGQSIGASASASVLQLNIQDWFPLKIDWFDSSTPQFKSINSLALSFLYSPTLTSIYDYWKNHSFD